MSMDVRSFRNVVGRFATGVTVIATEVDGEIRAMTANSFTSLSLDPPLVLFCAGKTTKMGQLVHAAAGFSVNILREDQQSISTYFAGGWKESQPPAFHFLPWHGGPRLDECAAALGCVMHTILEGGDHWIVIGRVLELHHGIESCDPLVFYGGRYGSLANTAGGPAPDLRAVADPILAEYW
jgi:3-hydroxy-9,10-secoandrosta-1,3,5(10)-triene-9,17-dione monooxygenase reductase component